MQKKTQTVSALIISGIAGIGIFLGIFLFWRTVHIPPAVLPQGLLIALFFSGILITMLIYQSRRLFDTANILAEQIARTMVEDSQDIFPQLYQNSPIPYIVINAQGNIDSMNIATARLFHVELNALLGLDFFRFVVEDRHAHASLIPEYFKKDRTINEVEVQITIPNEQVRWVSLSLFPFHNADAKKQGLLTLVDITKQKQIDRAKTEFVSLASHQLRTPISAMKWNLELLRSASEQTMQPIQKTYFEKIERNIGRMDMLIGDFLNVSKLELGTLIPQYAPLEIYTFINTVIDEYGVIAEKKGVRIEMENNTPLTIVTDTHLLHMVVSNLIGNAVKYTPHAGVVKVLIKHDAKMLTIVISDSGIGIPEAEQEMVFSKLFRATNAQEQIIEGTGLGLYIVQEAVRTLAGQISFVSHEGRGTSFTVVLPL